MTTSTKLRCRIQLLLEELRRLESKKAAITVAQNAAFGQLDNAIEDYAAALSAEMPMLKAGKRQRGRVSGPLLLFLFLVFVFGVLLV